MDITHSTLERTELLTTGKFEIMHDARCEQKNTPADIVLSDGFQAANYNSVKITDMPMRK